MYNGNLGAYDGVSVCRIRKANGALHNLPQGINQALWLGLDDNFYYHYWDEDTWPMVIKKVVIDSSYNVTISDYSSSTFAFYPPSCFKIVLQGRMIVVDYFSSPLNLYEVHNPTMTPRDITLTGITIEEIQFVVNSP